MTTAEASAVLGICVPRFSGKTQTDVEAQLQAWKDGPLKKTWREALHGCHPDKHPDDPTALERFKSVQEAYTFLCGLRVRLRVSRAAKKNDPLEVVLRKAGLEEATLEHLRVSGDLEVIRARGVQGIKVHVPLLLIQQARGMFRKG